MKVNIEFLKEIMTDKRFTKDEKHSILMSNPELLFDYGKLSDMTLEELKTINFIIGVTIVAGAVIKALNDTY